MNNICSTCKTGANTVEDEPFGCPFVDNLKDGHCKVFIGIDLANGPDMTGYSTIPNDQKEVRKNEKNSSNDL